MKSTTSQMRLDYWTLALDMLRDAQIELYQNISTGKDHWRNASSGVSSCSYALIHLKKEIRVELSLSRAEAQENTWLFDQLMQQKYEIEAKFDDQIEWMRLSDKKSSRIQFSTPCEGYDRERWPEYVAWHVEHIQKWEKALSGPIAELNQSLKARGTFE